MLQAAAQMCCRSRRAAYLQRSRVSRTRACLRYELVLADDRLSNEVSCLLVCEAEPRRPALSSLVPEEAQECKLFPKKAAIASALHLQPDLFLQLA